jgi:hypothetical protein
MHPGDVMHIERYAGHYANPARGPPCRVFYCHDGCFETEYPNCVTRTIVGWLPHFKGPATSSTTFGVIHNASAV